MPSQTQIRQEITERLVAALERDLVPWRRPWKPGAAGGLPRNIISGRRYQGINMPLLQMAALGGGHQSNHWATYRQWQGLCGQVRRGEKGTHIVLYKAVEKQAAKQEGSDTRSDRFFLLRTFVVFNLDQVEGESLDKHRQNDDRQAVVTPDFQPVEELVAAAGADIRHGGDRAYYAVPTPDGAWPAHLGGDYVQMPAKTAFIRPGMYYETLLHELAHWSECRLGWDRKAGGYALGELIAEMAACFLATELGVPQGESLENHAAYLRSWLDAMKGDPSFIFRAATQASKVTDFLLKFIVEAAAESEAVVAGF